VEPGCPVVVASAGGLEALEIFFSHMPPDPDIAFIIVSHIDPHATSFLPELLDRTTPMPVRAASDRKCLAPNEVVVTPPSKALTIEQGKVYLRDIVIPHGIPLPLDTLFRSLTDDQQEKSIGLVLSGTGTDGTLGLQAIKSILGMAMAQAPQSVKFSGMPQSAIDTGLMDYILPSDRMPSALLRYVQGPYLTRDVETAAGPVISSEVLQGILSLVYARTGHSFSAYKVSTTRRRLVSGADYALSYQ